MAKTEIDIKKLEDAASRLRAIAHPMRIAIIGLLEATPKLNVTEIYARLKIEQAAASHHLNILKNKGVLASKRAGKQTFYYLKNESLLQILECVSRCGNS
ncbi:MAG TPA: metalloregulator ArsR/SmtB family transcription factor [Bacteroidales bacterium]|nr:metalloregulator ArsR/SmtB family transcription factor [Bacteroidales bacterium]HPS17307.1 metalloregulator ArsR/SmtB family transcription factor [Bacteroidales bacterium]